MFEFNVYDYLENVEYCEYVYRKNIELGLGLKSPKEIQYVSNKYLDKIIADKGYVSDEVYENDSILKSVTEKAIRKLDNIIKNSGRKSKSMKTIEDNIMIRRENEKLNSRRGGKDFDDKYDDYGLDEAEEYKVGL